MEKAVKGKTLISLQPSCPMSRRDPFLFTFFSSKAEKGADRIGQPPCFHGRDDWIRTLKISSKYSEIW
jgi:hypothetical protein